MSWRCSKCDCEKGCSCAIEDKLDHIIERLIEITEKSSTLSEATLALLETNTTKD